MVVREGQVLFLVTLENCFPSLRVQDSIDRSLHKKMRHAEESEEYFEYSQTSKERNELI